MLTLGSIAGAIALIPGGGSAVGAIWTALGYLARCKVCLQIIGVAALVGWTAIHVHRADMKACDATIENKLEEQRTAAEAAAIQRDASIKTDLEKTFAPGLAAKQRLINVLQEKVNQYAKRVAAADKSSKGASGCKLGAAAGLLRPPPAAREAAGAAKGGIADYLRRNFNDD
jgi:hypothetical protein